MKIALCILCLLTAVSFTGSAERPEHQVTITVLYDNYVHEQGTTADWGFACLIEGLEKTILFDTGTNPGILKHNAGVLGINFEVVDLIILSHNHGDHTGGLNFVLGVNPDVTVFFPESFPASFVASVREHGAEAVPVGEATALCGNAWTTGEIAGPVNEQGLIVETADGLLLVTGCSHPGIAGMVERAGILRNGTVHTVLGGFHLMQHSPAQVQEIAAAFKELGVVQCGATHCTGDRAIAVFKEVFGEHYLPMGVGRKLSFPLPAE
ncbi:MBL fold metallo-hydrolase [bacterium]|nr:MBL fold metallo-hydrolase [bacterium]